MTKAQIPNALTLLRLLLAVVFFVMLSLEATYGNTVGLCVASALFIIAAVTDALDGHLARKWNVVSRFGRIMDPFCDKVLVLGAFALLSGPVFFKDGVQISAVMPWMVVIMLSRELLVTAIRSDMESGGTAFGAAMVGKLKMVLQSICVPVVLVLLAFSDALPDPTWAQWIIRILVWATVAATVVSGLPYLKAAFLKAGNTSKE